ncbi:YncE family protein [Prolixibacter bellariivorans]|nr:YncE family protein [Prolixibacter bellariivorans]
MKRNFLHISAAFFLVSLFLTGCMNDNAWIDAHRQGQSDQVLSGSGVFIVNEGNFMSGNATLSFYDITTGETTNNLFYRTNALPLGDVAQSMSILDSLGYIAINNSGKIYIINTATGKYSGKITGLTSPRYIHFVSQEKAYVTDLYASAITIFNPVTFQITGSISTPGHASTEQMVQIGSTLYVTCWSSDNTILKIDTGTDAVTGEIKVGKQPKSMVKDKNNQLWVLCDGNYGSTTSGGQAELQQANPETGQIEKSFALNSDNIASDLSINATRDTLYFINNDVWQMPVTASQLPATPVLKNPGTIYYGLGVDPENSDIYVSDAIDYLQQGLVYRLTAKGIPVDTMKTGIIPGSFCFRQ